MTDLIAAFDTKARAWQDYSTSLAGRLRHMVALHHVLAHLGEPPCDVLDAGCGTGEMAADLAALGFHLTLLDFSPVMLSLAAQRCSEFTVQTVCADATQAVGLLGAGRFDAVLCHSLLEFASNPIGLLGVLARLVRQDGLLSVMVGNRYHAPLRSVFVEGDYGRALREMDGESTGKDLFGLPRRTFTPEVMLDMLRVHRLQIVGEYGVRVFSDLLPASHAIPEDLLSLEVAASARLPYRHLARFLLFIAAKEGGAGA